MLSGRAIAILALVAAGLTVAAILWRDQGAPPLTAPTDTVPPAVAPAPPQAGPAKVPPAPAENRPNAVTAAEWRAHLMVRIKELEASIKAERTALRGVTELSVYNTRLMTLRQNISQLAQLRQELDLISPVTP